MEIQNCMFIRNKSALIPENDTYDIKETKLDFDYGQNQIENKGGFDSHKKHSSNLNITFENQNKLI